MTESRGLRLGQEASVGPEEKEPRDAGEEPPIPHAPSSSSSTCQSLGGRGA